ncbi:MAG: hypothetical protein ACKVS8_12700 [Phycisphaerales bacterium]
MPRPAPALGPLARDEWTGALPAELSQVYAFIACASADNRDGRWSEPAWVKRGVARLGDERALGMYRMGWCRFYVDSPFGKDTAKDGNPAFTFFGALRTPPDSPWNKGFVASWSAVTSKPDAYVVAYMGNPTWDTEFVALAGDLDTPADKAPDRAGAMRMLREAIRPLVEAGFKGLAIDALSNLPESHVVAEFLKAVQAAGIDVYIEATPVAAQPWLARFGTIRTTWFARWAPGFKGLLDPAECRGARIVLYEGTSPWPEADRKPYQEWVRRWVHECLARGEHPAIDAHSIVQPKRLFDLK